MIEGIVAGKLDWNPEDRETSFRQLDNYRSIFDFPLVGGLFLEFGVAGGGTLGKLAKAIAPRKIYGFDSFEGLPEAWAGYSVGSFAQNHKGIPLESNSELVVGLFQNTLVDFLEKHTGPVAYAHLDADLYSSTKFVLDHIKPRIVPGTILHFDEIKVYKDCDHEMRAFEEYMNETKTRWQILGQVTPFDGIFQLVP